MCLDLSRTTLLTSSVTFLPHVRLLLLLSWGTDIVHPRQIRLARYHRLYYHIRRSCWWRLCNKQHLQFNFYLPHCGVVENTCHKVINLQNAPAKQIDKTFSTQHTEVFPASWEPWKILGHFIRTVTSIMVCFASEHHHVLLACPMGHIDRHFHAW